MGPAGKSTVFIIVLFYTDLVCGMKSWECLCHDPILDHHHPLTRLVAALRPNITLTQHAYASAAMCAVIINQPNLTRLHDVVYGLYTVAAVTVYSSVSTGLLFI